ncbi:MAG: hypothetical protein AB1305_04745 [Candidatus Hadarchaeota archaeon]
MALSEEHYKQLVKFANSQIGKAPFLVKDIARSKIKDTLASNTSDSLLSDAPFILDYTVREVLDALIAAVNKGDI